MNRTVKAMRRASVGVLGALGLAVYLWPALSAPVVLWSDSAIDLGWARRGEGIFTPVVSTHHPPKPGYILFLRAALAAGPDASAERRIVVLQSLLLWAGIAAAALLVGRRRGPAWGAAVYLALVLMLRWRDASSAVMSEALTAALFLPLVAVLLDPPMRKSRAILLGLAMSVLFLVRPNAGAAALALGAASLAVHGRARRIGPLLLGFALLGVPVWSATGVPGDPFRGTAPAFITGSRDYGWTAQAEHPGPEPPPFAQVRTAWASWKRTPGEPGGDGGRQIVWRALHGPLGTEYYDARWSRFYERMTALSRTIQPLLTLACLATLIAAPRRGPARTEKVLGLLLAAMLVAQGLVLGALPRLALPLLPALLLLGLSAMPGLDTVSRRLAAALVFVLLVAAAAWQRQVLDWEWGRVEAAGIRIVQTIPRGALPEREPAVLHVRIAPLVIPTDAGVDVSYAGATLAPAMRTDFERPYLTVPLPQAVLSANRSGPIEIGVKSRGGFDEEHFLLFPIVPRPWGAAARRDDSAEISPATGVRTGSLDWWSHPGTE